MAYSQTTGRPSSRTPPGGRWKIPPTVTNLKMAAIW